MKKQLQALLTPVEVANLLGIKIETLQIWRCTRRYNIPYVKIGGRVRYKSSDLEDFIQNRTVQYQEQPAL
ncbi:MAG: helix-turn-helix domain-containing protein [Gammaproteobacteria bacterium]|nr:helix-turn-helix domain-containing protein [Gammaproteobacteria bacterium]